MSIFKETFSKDFDLLEQHLTKDILSQTDCNTTLTKFRTKFVNAFNSEFKERMQKYTRFSARSFQDAMICNMDSIKKYMREIILHQQRTPQSLKQKKLMQTQEDHSYTIQALNVDSLKVDLLVIQNTCSEKEDRNSETASNKLVKESNLNSETKDVHAIKYKMVNKRQMQTQKSKIDTGKALDNDLVIIERSGTESELQGDNSRSWNDTDANDADIRPIYDEMPMVEVQLTAECYIFAIGKQHTEQPEIINEGRADQWKPTGRFFKYVGLRWIPTGKLFNSCTSKDDGKPTHGLNVDIPNTHESKQTLDLSAVQASVQNVKELRLNTTVQASLVNVKEVPTTDMISMTTMIELESLFGPSFDEYFNGENQVISKPSAVTTADASDKLRRIELSEYDVCSEKKIRHLDYGIQYAVLGRRFDMSYPTGGYGVSGLKIYLGLDLTSEPMTSPSAFSFPDPLSSSTQQATFTFFSPGQTYITSEPVTNSQPNPQTSNNFQNQQFQQYHTATLSSNDAKFPYLKKEEYETLAMKMEYWIMNTDHNL
nr:hypothetical protein [Tanacetum cinerariifolium]